MSFDPHRASVVVDLLESATRTGALEKQEAAAILSSWIEEQKQVRSGASSPGPDSEPSQTPPPTQLILATAATAGTASTTMTIKTTTKTTTTSQAQAPPARLPGSPIFAASQAAAVSFEEATASLTPKSARRVSQKLSVGRHASVPSTPTVAGQFSFLPQQPSPSLPPPSTSTPAATTAAASAGQPRQRQSLQRQRNRRSVQPMRSLLHVFAACAVGASGDEDSGESEPGSSELTHHRFYLDPQPMPQMPPLPPPPQMTLPPPPTTLLSLSRPESSSSDPQTYAVYDAELHTYCYIDDADLDFSRPTAATGSKKLACVHSEDAASPSGTSDSGVYGSGSRVEGTT